MELPQELLEKLHNMLGDETEKFSELKNEQPYKGLRVNTLKISVEDFLKLGLSLKKSPFCNVGYYIDNDRKLGNSPYHHAGAFYLQEPSASGVISVVDPKPYEYILDLCAAPGGKTTGIAAALRGTGLIWANEISQKRALTLLSNFERMGIFAGVVSSTHPSVLCETLEGAFDKVVVDAPCSGEGMMRKEPTIADEWSEENVKSCATRQAEILDSAAKAVRDGGQLIYSTCTFSPEENEYTVLNFLKRHPEFSLIPCGVDFGRAGFFGCPETRRVFWTDGGEGHFMAKLQKCGNERRRDIGGLSADNCTLWDDFAAANGITLPNGIIRIIKDRVYLSPDIGITVPGILRCGLLLGQTAKGRFIPEHAMYTCPDVKTEKVINLEITDPRVAKFLHGEEIPCEGEKGFTRLSINNIPTGFGKLSGGVLKNYYPKGLRTL